MPRGIVFDSAGRFYVLLFRQITAESRLINPSPKEVGKIIIEKNKRKASHIEAAKLSEIFKIGGSWRVATDEGKIFRHFSSIFAGGRTEFASAFFLLYNA